MNYEWSTDKATANFKKHGIDFADAVGVFEDEHAITIEDNDAEGERVFIPSAWISFYETWWSSTHIGALTPLGSFRRVRQQGKRERHMKNEYDFNKGKRGAVASSEPGKTRITIRLDNEVLDWFRDKVNRQGGGNYQTLINLALKEYISQDQPLPEIIRQVIREELKKVA